MNLRLAIASSLLLISLALITIVAQREFFPQGYSPSVPAPVVSGDRDYYPTADWLQERDEAINISVFPYRDRNRNGLYDVGDSPMVGIAVTMTLPGGTQLNERSNSNGYANFPINKGSGEREIHAPGSGYIVNAEVPSEWLVTSGNARQVLEFIDLQGSPAGLVAKRPPEVIGFAPTLRFSGTVRGLRADDRLVLSVDGQDVQLTTVQVEAGTSAFSGVVPPGSWVLSVERMGSLTVIRRGEIIDVPVTVGVVDVAQQKPDALPNVVIQDFESVGHAPIKKLALGERGLDWDYLLAVDYQTYHGPGYVNGLQSGHAVGYNSSGHPVTIRSVSPGSKFDFGGGYFSVAWPTAEGEVLDIEAWRGNQLVAEDHLVLSSLGPVWFDADYRSIDRLTLTSRHYWQFIADDLLFRLPAADSVREVGPQQTEKPIDPWLSQWDIVDPKSDLAAVMCGPAALANVWPLAPDLSDALDLKRKLAIELSSGQYLDTKAWSGTPLQALINGTLSYARDHGVDFESFSFTGDAEPSYLRRGHYVSPLALQAAIREGATVLLNVGFYTSINANEGEETYARVGGHWIVVETVEGFNDTVKVLFRDPANTASALITSGLSSGFLRKATVLQEGEPFRAEGGFVIDPSFGRPILSDFQRPKGATLAAIDAAVVWRVDQVTQ